MQIWHLMGCARRPVIIAAAGAVLTVFGSLAGAALPQLVSQKGREFTPGTVNIGRGEAVQIVNDDGDLRHHAYISSNTFSYDSGDQEPGTKASITFPVAGDFDVLCAIHPKMKLTVHVK
jgi:plastocyanin